MKYLAACCVFKSESRYLREWVEYHRIVGFERFYMVSNDDSPDSAESVLGPFVSSGELVLYSCPGGPFVSLQTEIYKTVLDSVRGQVRWLAFLDADEFLLPVEAPTVSQLLEHYEQYAALSLNWACFGSSGFIEPQPLQTVAYRMRAIDEHEHNRVYKSIIDPSRAIEPYSPHGFALKEPWVLVDEFERPVTHLWRNENTPFFGKQMRINHYRTRSAREYAEKLARWRGGGHPDLDGEADARQFWECNDLNEVRDETIQRFVPELMRRVT